MKTSKWRRTCFALQGLLLPVAAAAAQGIQYTRIIGTGDQVPGVRGFTITGFGLFLPQIDNAGNVLFAAGWQSGPTPFDTQGGLFYGGPGSLVPVQIQGQQAPGLPDGWYIYPNWLYVLSENGTIAMKVSALGTPGNGGHGVYVGPAGSLELVAGTDLPAVGDVPGTTTGIGDLFRANGLGQVAFVQGVSNRGGSPASYFTITAGSAGAFGTAYQSYGPVPGIPDATFLPNIGDALTYGDLGWVGFHAFMQGPGIDQTNNLGLFLGTPGDVQVIARTGSQAPDMPTGVTFTNFSPAPGQNAYGNVGFFGHVQGPGITASNDVAYWFGPRGAPQVTVRIGDAAPALPGYTLQQFNWATYLGKDDTILFSGRLSGPGLTPGNDDAVWYGPPGEPQILLREGDSVPGFGPEVSIPLADTVAFARNAAGDVLMFDALTGGGFDPANDYAWWLRSAGTGTWELLLQTGQQFDGRTIESGTSAVTILPGAGTEGYGRAINDNGEFIAKIRFTDGTSALYRFTVPEPGIGLLAGLGILAALPRRKQPL